MVGIMDFIGETWPLIMVLVYLFMLCILPGSFVGYSFLYLPYLLTSLCFFGWAIILCTARPKIVGRGHETIVMTQIIAMLLAVVFSVAATLLLFKFKLNKRNIFAGVVGILFSVVLFSLGAYLLGIPQGFNW
jgi:hypothetical protein